MTCNCDSAFKLVEQKDFAGKAFVKCYRSWTASGFVTFMAVDNLVTVFDEPLDKSQFSSAFKQNNPDWDDFDWALVSLVDVNTSASTSSVVKGDAVNIVKIEKVSP